MAQLIIYFSRAGGNYVNGTIKDLPVGNTEIAAKMIREITGADIFKIEPVTMYPADYNECIEQAKDDQRRDARPELKEYPDNLEGYDTIYLGYPNYWGTMPMAVFTFLEILILTESASCRSVHMKAAGWAAVKGISGVFVAGQL